MKNKNRKKEGLDAYRKKEGLDAYRKKDAEDEIKDKALILLKEVAEVAVMLVVILLVLRLLLGPTAGFVPMVVVESGSMEHHGDSWETWLIDRGVSSEEIKKFPLNGGFYKGDIIVTKWGKVELGDVVIYNRDLHHSNNEPPIIHRVVGVVDVRGWDVEGVGGTTDCITDFTPYINHVKSCAQAKDGTNECVFPDEKCYRKAQIKAGNFTIYITKGDNNKVPDQCGNIAYPVNSHQVVTKAWLTIPKVGYLRLWLSDLMGG